MILKEYALDPTIIKNWDKCRAFIEPFGITTGRQISGYPKFKDWKSLLLNNLEVLPKEKLKIVEYLKIKRGDNNSFIKKSRLYNKTKNWITNVEEEQNNLPFHAVISSKNSTYTHENFIVDDEFSDLHDLMETSVDVPICRSVLELTNHITPLLDQSRTIIFVDPYFVGTKKKYLNPLKDFLVKIVSNPLGLSRVSIQYHHNDGGTISNPTDTYNVDEIINEWRVKILPIIPSDFTIQFHMWPFKDLHNRYILTDVYGVSYGRGLSEDNTGFADEDEILGLGLEVWRARYEKYLNNAPEHYLELSKE